MMKCFNGHKASSFLKHKQVSWQKIPYSCEGRNVFSEASWPGADTLVIVPEASFIRQDLVEYPKIRHMMQSLTEDLK